MSKFGRVKMPTTMPKRPSFSPPINPAAAGQFADAGTGMMGMIKKEANKADAERLKVQGELGQDFTKIMDLKDCQAH
mgnify:CR=1 FL=1